MVNEQRLEAARIFHPRIYDNQSPVPRKPRKYFKVKKTQKERSIGYQSINPIKVDVRAITKVYKLTIFYS